MEKLVRVFTKCFQIQPVESEKFLLPTVMSTLILI